MRFFLHCFARLIATIIVPLVFRYKTMGERNLPARGGVIIGANHQSYLDPIFLGLAARRPIYFMAKKELFKWKPFAILITLFNAFPVNREGTGKDALRKAIELVKKGEVVLMFVEGTRGESDDVGEVKAGISMVAARSGGIIVPAFISGAWKAWPRHKRFFQRARVSVIFGKGFWASEHNKIESGKVPYKEVPKVMKNSLLFLRSIVKDGVF